MLVLKLYGHFETTGIISRISPKSSFQIDNIPFLRQHSQQITYEHRRYGAITTMARIHGG